MNNASLARHALESMSDGVVIVDKMGTIEYINPAYCAMIGYEMDEVIGQNINILRSDKQPSNLYASIRETLEKSHVWRGELWNKRKDNSHFLEELSITPVSNGDNNISHYVSLKRYANKHMDLFARLENAQKMEAIGKLTGGIAHNFNNKLATIMGYTELMLESLEEEPHEDFTELANEVLTASKAAHELINQMISFSRTNELPFEPVKVIPAIKDIIKVLGSTLPSTVSLTTNFDENIPDIKSDPVEMYQMLVILALNARDAMNNNGNIEIGVHYANYDGAVCNSCHADLHGNYVDISVTDSGCGIAPEDIGNLFVPFFTTRELSSTTGMGLSVLHGMLHRHSSHVVIDTQLQKGVAFHLLFPADM